MRPFGVPRGLIHVWFWMVLVNTCLLEDYGEGSFGHRGCGGAINMGWMPRDRVADVSEALRINRVELYAEPQGHIWESNIRQWEMGTGERRVDGQERESNMIDNRQFHKAGGLMEKVLPRLRIRSGDLNLVFLPRTTPQTGFKSTTECAHFKVGGLWKLGGRKRSKTMGTKKENRATAHKPFGDYKGSNNRRDNKRLQLKRWSMTNEDNRDDKDQQIGNKGITDATSMEKRSGGTKNKKGMATTQDEDAVVAWGPGSGKEN